LGAGWRQATSSSREVDSGDDLPGRVLAPAPEDLGLRRHGNRGNPLTIVSTNPPGVHGTRIDTQHIAAGASPVWWAGGGPAVPLWERLAVRSRACCAPGGRPVAVGCWFLASPLSVGSLGAARALAAAGGSAVVFCCGWESSLLPALLPGGGWVAVCSGPFAGGFVWVPAGSLSPSWAARADCEWG
jgi:hypothetical protein